MKHLVCAMAFVAGLAVHAQGSEAATLSFDPGSITVDAGQTFTLDLRATDLPELTLGGSVDLSYAANVLRLDNVVVNETAWEFDSDPGEIDNTNGKLDFLSFGSFRGRSGNVDIAKLTFTAIRDGSSALRLSENPLNPFVSVDDDDDEATRFNPTLVDGSVTVTATAVPLPAGAWLLGSGLAALIAPARRRRVTA